MTDPAVMGRLWDEARGDAEALGRLIAALAAEGDPRAEVLALTRERQDLGGWLAILRAAEDQPLEALDELGPFLDAWPDAVRQPMLWTRELLQGGDPPLVALCRHLSIFAPVPAPDLAQLEALATSPALRHMTRLTVSNARLEDEGLAALAASPHLTAVTHLDLSSNRLRVGAASLSTSAMAPTLRELSLWSNALVPDGLRALGREHLPALTHLNVGHNPLGASGARALIESSLRLESLDIYQCGLGDAGMEALASHAPLTGLQSLRAQNNGLGLRAAVAIADHLRQLRVLSLNDNPALDDAGLLALAGLGSLESLDLDSAAITDAGAVALAGRPMPRLRRLNLTRTRITGAGVLALLRSPQLPSLRVLCAERVPFNASDIRALASQPWDHPLEDLFIPLDAAGREGCLALVESSRFPTDTRLRAMEKLGLHDLKALARGRIKGHSKLNLKALRQSLIEHFGLTR